jgi:glycine/D-amino acid oxidase-like deaminating enzyme
LQEVIPMSRNVDVLIAGGGIVGMSIAFQIARRSNCTVMVADKGVGPGEGSTGASSAVCRFKYTHGEMVRLARDGIGAYRQWAEFTGLKSPRAQYHGLGVLWLGGEADDWAGAESARLAGHGIRAEVLGDGEVRARFPALNPCVVAPDLDAGAEHQCRFGGRHLFETDGGYVDPVSALQDLIEAARGRGVDVRFQSEVTDVHREGGKVVGATLADGERVGCGALVCASGPWCNALLDGVGLGGRWPLEPTRIQIVHIDRPDSVSGDIPVCADTVGGIYFRTQNRGQQILVGSVLSEDEEEIVDPDNFASYVDDDFARAKLHALQHRIPGLSYAAAVHGYSGLYTINRKDMHPVVGASPIEGFFVSNGFSGHGFKLAPAVGSLVAQAITGDSLDMFDTAVGPEFLAFERAPIALASKTVLA